MALTRTVRLAIAALVLATGLLSGAGASRHVAGLSGCRVCPNVVSGQGLSQ